jgi:alkylation response protein AidB-like acyl-CoA dehydrogenase
MLSRNAPDQRSETLATVFTSGADLQFGSDQQKEKYLPQLARGDIIGCFVGERSVGMVANADRRD